MCNWVVYWLFGLLGDLKLGELIVLYFDKSDLVVVIMFGIWKVGVVFVLIELSYLLECVFFILYDM